MDLYLSRTIQSRTRVAPIAHRISRVVTGLHLLPTTGIHIHIHTHHHVSRYIRLHPRVVGIIQDTASSFHRITRMDPVNLKVIPINKRCIPRNHPFIQDTPAMPFHRLT
jgi:hypothetical protein